MGKVKMNLTKLVNLIKAKLINWSSAGIVSTDPLTEKERAELIKKREDKHG